MNSASSCSHHTAAPDNSPQIPLIKVNGHQISEEEIARELQYHPADSADQAIHLAAEALIVKHLLLQRADELSVTAAAVNGETEEESVIRQLLDKEVEIPAADAASCRQYYDANPEKFCSPPLLEVDHILLGVAPDDIKGRRECREQAEALIQQLEKNINLFPEFAREFSACPSKEQGGNLGQISKGQTVAEFEKQLFMLSPGLAHKPVESRYGFHVVRVANRIDGQQMPYELCENRISDYLKDHAWVKAVSQYVSMLMGEADIEGLDNPGAATPLVQ